jgi:hypothetical protein
MAQLSNSGIFHGEETKARRRLSRVLASERLFLINSTCVSIKPFVGFRAVWAFPTYSRILAK